MRKFGAGRAVYHTAGFYVKQLPRILERGEDFTGLLNQIRPDIVHFNDGVPFNRGEILGSRWARVPTLCHVRSFEPLNHFDRWLAPGVHRYIFISQAIADWFRSTGVKIKAWDIVLNGIDLTEIGPMPEARPAMRRELGLPQDAYVAAILGRLTPWKGQETFLSALDSIASDYPRLWGLLVGDSNQHFVDFESALRAKAETGSMRGRVVFAGLRLDVNRVLSAVDVLVHASLEPEPFGRVVIEGMAAQVPVIASAAGAVPEIITHDRTGLLFTPGDEGSLGLQIKRLMDAPELSGQLAANARREVESRFAIDLHVAKIQAIYEEMP
jgi:glycosyltransferase involved in cell wall biosynthesis